MISATDPHESDKRRIPRVRYAGKLATKMDIDNRGLQPPEPMVRILGALATLPLGDELVALMDREPMMIYPELERRGFEWEFHPGDESHRLVIRRAQE